ncbi:MAG: ABC transporter permease [Clostridiales bacterium]|nr:ABC transporter permease [Clostridiales bacterium]
MKRYLSDRLPVVLFALLFLAVVVTFQCLQPTFLSSANIVNMMQSVSTTVIAAIGLTFVIAIGRSDISFYMSCCFCGVLMAWLVSLGWHPVPAILCGVAAGAAWGSVSGFAVGKLKLPDIITTIAIGSIAFGLGYLFSDGAFIMQNFIEAKTHYLSQYLVLGIPLPVYVMAAVMVLSYYLLERSRFGRAFYAVGATEKAAYLSGVNVNRTIVLAYVICGTLASVAALIMTARQGYGNVKIGMNLLMPCFTAVYIGMSVFKRPCVVGTALGALLVTAIATGFTSINIPFYVSNLVTGFVLILAILLSKVVVREKQPRMAAKEAGRT